jgi:hypothetical protein
MWRGRRRPRKPTVPAWRACRATRAGAAKRVRSADNIFEVLFFKNKLKRLKLKNHPKGCVLRMRAKLCDSEFRRQDPKRIAAFGISCETRKRNGSRVRSQNKNGLNSSREHKQAMMMDDCRE